MCVHVYIYVHVGVCGVCICIFVCMYVFDIQFRCMYRRRQLNHVVLDPQKIV